MSKVAAFMLTRDRLEYTKRTLKSLFRNPGHDLDLYIFDNGSTDGTHLWLETQKEYEFDYWLNKENLGQHIASNRCIKWIRESGDYDFILRIDNDCEFKTGKWLKKLLQAYDTMFKDKMAILSPLVMGLNNPPQPYGVRSAGKFLFWFIEIAGGICRLHPTKLFDDFSFNERQALAFGEATHLAAYCQENSIPICYVINIKAEHMDTTSEQVATLPAYFERSEMERYLPYGI